MRAVVRFIAIQPELGLCRLSSGLCRECAEVKRGDLTVGGRQGGVVRSPACMGHGERADEGEFLRRVACGA